jgi:hypothetical protein
MKCTSTCVGQVMMNATAAPSKRSTLERQLDKLIMFMFGLLAAMCVIDAVGDAVWIDKVTLRPLSLGLLSSSHLRLDRCNKRGMRHSSHTSSMHPFGGWTIVMNEEMRHSSCTGKPCTLSCLVLSGLVLSCLYPDPNPLTWLAIMGVCWWLVVLVMI